MNAKTKFSIVLLVAFFGIFQNTFGQYSSCFYITTAKASFEYYKKNYKASADLYEKAFALQPTAFPQDFMLAAKANAVLKNSKKAFAYLEKAIIRGAIWEEIIEDTVWNNLQKTATWKKLKSKYAEFHSKYLLGINQELYKEIISMNAFDQQVRNHFDNPKLYAMTDSIHLSTLKTMVADSNFPAYDSFPYQERIDFLILIVHAIQRDSSNWQYFQPILFKQITQGNLTPSEYALLTNTYYHSWKDLSYYGNVNRSKKFVPPILEVSTIEKRRQQLGLLSLKDFANLVKLTVMPTDYQELENYYTEICP